MRRKHHLKSTRVRGLHHVVTARCKVVLQPSHCTQLLTPSFNNQVLPPDLMAAAFSFGVLFPYSGMPMTSALRHTHRTAAAARAVSADSAFMSLCCGTDDWLQSNFRRALAYLRHSEVGPAAVPLAAS